MIIRMAELSDIGQCAELSKRFYEVAGYSEHVELCEESITDWLEISIDQGLTCI